MTNILRVFGSLPLLGMLAASLGPANAMQIQLNTGAPYLCVTVEGGNTAPGTPVITYSCSGGPEDQWNFVKGGVYSNIQGIGTANGVSMCLTVNSLVYPPPPGTLVVLDTCNFTVFQSWGFLGGPIGGVLSGMCLDSAGPSVGGGTQLVLNPCTGAASQNWIVRGTQLASPTAPYKCANVKGSKTANGTPVIAYSCDGGPNELWNVVNGGNIQGIGTENANTTCLTASGLSVGSLVNLSSCVAAEASQEWVLGDVGNSTACWLRSTLLCLDSAGPSVGGGTQLVINDCTGATSQTWILR